MNCTTLSSTSDRPGRRRLTRSLALVTLFRILFLTPLDATTSSLLLSLLLLVAVNNFGDILEASLLKLNLLWSAMNDFDLWLERLGVNAQRHEEQMLHMNREKTAADFIVGCWRLNKVLFDCYEVDIMCRGAQPKRGGTWI